MYVSTVPSVTVLLWMWILPKHSCVQLPEPWHLPQAALQPWQHSVWWEWLRHWCVQQVPVLKHLCCWQSVVWHCPAHPHAQIQKQKQKRAWSSICAVCVCVLIFVSHDTSSICAACDLLRRKLNAGVSLWFIRDYQLTDAWHKARRRYWMYWIACFVVSEPLQINPVRKRDTYGSPKIPWEAWYPEHGSKKPRRSGVLPVVLENRPLRCQEEYYPSLPSGYGQKHARGDPGRENQHQASRVQMLWREWAGNARSRNEAAGDLVRWQLLLDMDTSATSEDVNWSVIPFARYGNSNMLDSHGLGTDHPFCLSISLYLLFLSFLPAQELPIRLKDTLTWVKTRNWSWKHVSQLRLQALWQGKNLNFAIDHWLRSRVFRRDTQVLSADASLISLHVSLFSVPGSGAKRREHSTCIFAMASVSGMAPGWLSRAA